MIELNVYVNRKGTDKPTGIVEALNNGSATVRWGWNNGKVTEDIPLRDLEVCLHHITSSDEVQIRQAKESGMPFHKIEGGE